MSELSVFVDESGDVGTDSEYYLVTFVFHDQSRPIDGALVKLGAHLQNIGFPKREAIHSGPLIRRERPFSNMDGALRVKAFRALFNFTMGVDVSFASLAYRKRELGAREPGDIASRLRERLTRDIGLYLRERLGYFARFDKVIVYYDNGQHAVGRALREAFEAELSRVEFRLVRPSDYRLFQAADLVCTLELLRLKDAAGELSRSEVAFFGSPGRLRRNYLRHVERLRLG